jgi:tripartite-type tricarboxylate transporter receptor subunit TctC
MTVSPSLAQTWPARPIRLVMAYSAGGSGDIVARALAQKMSEAWPHPVVVENRPGATGSIGTAYVAKSPADGYTLLLGSDVEFAVSPALGIKLPFDPEKDFEPISLVALLQLVLAASPSLPANNLAELVALAKSRPGSVNYASTGIGSTSHLAIEMLKRRGGFELVHVPYKGSGQALPDLISGHVQLMQLGLPQTLPHLKAGRLKALGVAAADRIAALPEVPTVAEQGFPGYEANNSWCLYAPAGTPKDVISALHSEIVRVVRLQDIRERFNSSGLEPVGSSPEELAARMRSDRLKWSTLIHEAGIRVEQ